MYKSSNVENPTHADRSNPTSPPPSRKYNHLARSAARNVLTRVTRLAPRHIHIPSPICTRARTTTINVDIRSITANSTRDPTQRQIRDRHTRRSAGPIVRLRDNDAVVGPARDGDVLVRDALDRARVARDGLDAHGLLAVDDLAALKRHVRDRVVVAAAHGADGQPMAAGAVAAGEDDAGARVDCDTVVLVVDFCVGDGHTRRAADVEAVGIGAQVVAVLVVDSDVCEGEGSGVVDTEHLYGGVQDRDAADGRCSQVVYIFVLALIRAQKVPVYVAPPHQCRETYALGRTWASSFHR